MMHILHTRFARMRLVLLSLLALALFASGCSEPFTAYHLSGDQHYLAEGRKVLVMPFMDTRTFIDKDDTHRADLGTHARSIFVGAMRAYNANAVADIMTPAMPQPMKSLTNAEVAEIGRQYNADYVVSGQVFSYTGTRAASIPPRAGMFIRVISASDGSLLFVGDHYQAASIPGASGGRELQAKNVSSRLVEGFLAKAQATVATARSVASTGALAMLSPVPVAKHRRAPANKSGRDRTHGNAPRPEPKPVFPGFAGGNMFNPEEWDEQIVPEVPPVMDYQEDFYALPAPPLPEAPPVVPAPAPAGEGDATAPDVASADADADGVFDEADKAPTPAETPRNADPVASALESIQERREESASAPERYESVPETAPASTARNGEDDVHASLSAVETKRETASSPGSPLYPEAETVVAERTVVETVEPVEGTGQFYRSHVSDGFVDTSAANVIDELPELDIRKVDPNMISLDAPPAAPVAAGLTGDELAEDLFADIDAPASGAKASGAVAGVSVANGERETGGARPQTQALPASGSTGPTGGARREVSAAAGAESMAQSRPATRRLPPPAATPQGVRAPQRAEAAWANDNGPVVSVPLGVEQPNTVKSVNLELTEDPDAIRQEPEALVAVPRRGDPAGIRVLILPYHDLPNGNNLIPNTGGGEVVTTLYGTQLALDPGVTLMWDGSGQATHDRLVSREDAIMMGRLAGADYVMRGQVLEFRRAQSVPSFYSAMISTAVLAAQMFFAEMSGVDVATEVYRVADGMCVMSRRDRSQQKYVVQAEKTVRRMAAGMADDVWRAIRQLRPVPMDPLIDELASMTALAGAR